MNLRKSVTSHGLSVLAGAALAGLLFLLPAGAATIPSAAAPETEAVPDLFRQGPHQQLTCTKCHKEKAGQQPQSEESVTEDSIRLCRGCHPVSHLHPIGVAPGPQPLAEDLSLPLGKGPLLGQIVCHTCHAIHQHENNPFLLREQKIAGTRGRSALCFHCHVDRFPGKFPHTGEEASCRFCHICRPQTKEGPGTAPDPRMQAACLLCHGNLPAVHYDGVNPFIDRVVRDRAEQAGNFLREGREVCTTCHDPHDRKNGKYLLRGDYLALCKESRALNPHRNDYLCLSCHQEPPVKGHAPLREGGDINKLCNWCHHSEYARPDIHPVGIKPTKHARIPEDLPLQNEKLTCETCHNSLLQMGCRQTGDEVASNPYFLRKKTDSRTAFCFLCHIEEAYKRLNPHTQLNEKGERVEATCLFCHATIPDVNFLGPEKVSFIVKDPNEYCIGCHPGFTGNHPAGANHLREPSKKILAAIRTSVQRIGVELPLFQGKIICATCHNPHQEGVIQIAAAATGTKRENKLRLKPGRNLSTECIGCHWDK